MSPSETERDIKSSQIVTQRPQRHHEMSHKDTTLTFNLKQLPLSELLSDL